ncbi:MAG: helix-turn-helix transcriptional regulator [Actinomycetaceae bacterium]|nr:helix-turn-helix transcriptional regulator [Actinomycetaceae bacterium]
MADPSPLEYVFAKHLGSVLRTRRQELGLSQEQVALRADIDRRHYQDLEYGMSNSRNRTPANPRLSTLFALSRALEMSIVDLLDSASKDMKEHIKQI